MTEHVTCTRCGEQTAISEDTLARIRARHPGIKIPPFFVANVCFRCAFQDPAIRADIEAWTRETYAEMFATLREGLARPLEKIDELVERFL